MRLLVCGGRDYAHAPTLEAALDRIDAEHCVDLIIHGDGPGRPGADKLADRWARKRGVPVWPIAADWARYGNAAGPIRNQRMIDEASPTHFVAFHGGTGTADMVDRARKAGLVEAAP